jgi:hypothetical protein
MPAGGFATLISPALKPTLMPQPPLHHRGSLSGQPILVSTARGQSLLVSPSLKPWLPGGNIYFSLVLHIRDIIRLFLLIACFFFFFFFFVLF